MAKIELININKNLAGNFNSKKAAYGALSIGSLKGNDAISQKLMNDTIGYNKISNVHMGDFSLKGIDLTIPEGKTMVILGPSGCGKTTVLRLIAGLIRPDSGTILFDGVDMHKIKAGDRKIGMVFQNYALYPKFNSKKNILSYFVFKKQTEELLKDAEEKFKRTSELMGVELEYLLNKMPHHLSGGEKQRVAIGRCITRDPSVFLLDEPFSNLDQLLREKYRINLKKLLSRFNVTSVYVTHDQLEALILSDIIAVMNNGEIIQTGTYEELYNMPANRFVAEFLNIEMDAPSINFIDGSLFDYKNRTIGVRPKDIKIIPSKAPKSVQGVITHFKNIPIKGRTIVNIKADDNDLIMIGENKKYKLNQKVWVKFDKMHLFDNANGKNTAWEG